MIVFEFKVKAKPTQYAAIDEAIQTSQFVRNKCLRYWMDNEGASKYDLNFYQLDQIKRVRLVRRADGYYAQFAVKVDVRIKTQPTGRAIGLDLGIKYFLADSNGHTEESPKFYRKSERQLNRANRKKSKKYRKGAKPQSRTQAG